MPEAYGSALLIVVMSVAAGQGLAALAGARGWWWPGPATGFAALMAVAALAVRVPGGATLAAVAVAAVAAVGAVALRHRRPPAPAWGAAAGALAVTALPFLAQERVGLPGVSLNNDTATHLLWAEGLRDAGLRDLYALPEGYPLGIHSLVTAVGEGTGLELDGVLTGLLIALPVLVAVTAAGLLDRLPGPLRAAASVLAAFAYLSAAYWGQGSFKEVAMSLFLLALVAMVRDVAARAGHAPEAGAAGDPGPAARRGPLAFAPAGLLLGGCLLNYSYFGLGWPLGFLGIWALAAVAATRPRPRPAELAARLRPLAIPAAVAAGVALLTVAGDLVRLLRFASDIGISPAASGLPTSDLGNLPGPLSAFEALGIWPSVDYRFAPGTGLLFLLEALAVAAAGAAFVVWVRRRDLALPAALAACAALYAVTDATQSAYVTAKGLAAAAPLDVVLVPGGLLPAGRPPARGGARGWTVAGTALAGAFVLAAAWSSQMALRWTPIESAADRASLEALRPPLAGRTVLFLGDDDYVLWRLRGARVADLTPALGPQSTVPAQSRAEKPWRPGEPLDFDSVDAATLDGFDAVVTTDSAFQSAPPANFRELARSGMYVAWEREGATPSRTVVDAPAQPGGILDCASRPPGGGTAAALTAPVVLAGLTPLGTGEVTGLHLALAPGRWRLSLSYVSPIPVRVETAGRRWTMPAYTGRPGPHFDVGEVDVAAGEPTIVTLVGERVSRLTGPALARLGTLAAMPVGSGRELPQSDACNQYVDYLTAG